MSKELANELLLHNLERVHEDIKDLRDELRFFRNELKELNSFKFKIYGIAMALSAAMTFIVGLIN